MFIWVASLFASPRCFVRATASLAGLAGLATGGRAAVVWGVVEVRGGIVTWLLRRGSPWMGPIAAMTLGHVILGRDQECLDRSRLHEHVHVRQYERWGPLFLPMYLGASVWCWVRGFDPYLDNPFEQEAYAADAERRQLP